MVYNQGMETDADIEALELEDAANHVLYFVNEGGYPPGSFTTKLLQAWAAADLINSAKLGAVFPAYGWCMDRYKAGDTEGLKNAARSSRV